MNRISLLGIPHDENSSYLRGAAEAPAPIRRELHCDAYSSWSETGVDLSVPGRLIDRGDVAFDTQSDPWERIERDAASTLDGVGPLISLGGDHAITYPILRALRRRHPRLTILHIDAHADLYDAYQGNPRSHASPFARIMEEGLADRLIQWQGAASTDPAVRAAVAQSNQLRSEHRSRLPSARDFDTDVPLNAVEWAGRASEALQLC